MKKRVKKIILAVLFFCIAATQFPVSAYAQTSSKEKPDLTISSARQWNEFAAQVREGNDFKGKLVKLTKDIEFDENSLSNFGMAGQMGRSFDGTFDGGGYTIRGMVFRDSVAARVQHDVGMFPYLESNGTIKNLTIENSNFIVTNWSALSAGYGVICGISSGTIENCHIVNSEVIGNHDIGGIVGENLGIVINCSSNASVSSSKDSRAGRIGGIVGANAGSICNCFSNGRVDGRLHDKNDYNNNIVGGIVGYNVGSVVNCYSTSVLFNEGDIAGIVGSDKNGIIKNCYYDESTALLAYHHIVNTAPVVTNVKSMTLSEMGKKSFVKELNKNRGTNSSWLKWELVEDTPTFVPSYEVTFKDTKNGYAKVNNGYTNQGKKITLTLVPDRNYQLSSVQVKTSSGKTVQLTKKNKAGTKYTFTMPNDDVVVTVDFKKK